MGSQNLPPVPFTAKVLSGDGSLSQPWTGWFRQLFDRLGGLNGSPFISDGSVTTPILADAAVTAPKIDGGAITTAKIADTAVTTPKLADNSVTFAKILSYRKVTGTRTVPISITASGGISPSGVVDEIIYIGGSPGHVTISANPQIAAGTSVGQRLTLRVPVGSNGVLTQDGAGLSQNGPADLGVDTFSMSYEWDGSVWFCTGRD